MTDKEGELRVSEYTKFEFSNNKYTIVDQDGYKILITGGWYINNRGYCVKSYYPKGGKGKLITLSLHREIMKASAADFIDHINGNRIDNRKCNLRFASQNQNQWNSKIRKGSSKYKGVCWSKNRNIWHSGINYNGKRINLGCYKDEIDAAKAYNVKALELFGEFACINKFNGD